MPSLVSVKTAFPAHRYTQDQIVESLLEIWKETYKNTNRLEAIQKNVQVGARSLSQPLEDYFTPQTFGERNKRFIESSLDMMERATNELLSEVGLKPQDIQSIWSNTVTGFAIPSLEARLMNRLPFKTDTKRIPMMGLGCMAGVAGINRVCDYLKGHPNEAALFLSVEACSLTFQLEDVSLANVVSTGLFGDGCAAVLLVGENHPLNTNAALKYLSSGSAFFPETEDVMGWDVSERGLKIILNKNVPDVTRDHLAPAIEQFLKDNGVHRNELSQILAHPGGPKVLLALETIMDLPEKSLKHSWSSLEERGNMSSVSVLDIFQRHIKEYNSLKKEWKGHLALAVAMGPAFSGEMGLFRWN